MTSNDVMQWSVAIAVAALSFLVAVYAISLVVDVIRDTWRGKPSEQINKTPLEWMEER